MPTSTTPAPTGAPAPALAGTTPAPTGTTEPTAPAPDTGDRGA